jgi:hypothetical protein
VVAAEGDDAGEGLAGFAYAGLLGGGGGAARQERVVAVFDLLQGVRVVVGGYGDVPAVEDFAPEVEGVGVEGSGGGLVVVVVWMGERGLHVVSAAESEFA